MEDSLLSDDKTPRTLLRRLMANLGPEETPEVLLPHRLRRQAASSAKRKRGGAGGSSSKRSKGGEDASLLKVALQPQSRQSQQFSTSRNESLNASTIKGTDLTYMNITAFDSGESSTNESIDLTVATRFRKRKQRPREYDAQSEVSKLVIKPPIGTRSRKKHPQAKKSSRATGDSASRAKTEVTLPIETTYAAIDTSLIDSSSDSIDYGKARNLRHRPKKEAIEFQQKLVKPSMASKTSTKGSDSELVEKTYANLSICGLELSSDSSIDLGAARNMRKRTRLQVMAIPDVDPAAFAHKPSKDTSQMQLRGSDKSLQMSPSKSPRKSSSLQKDSDMSPRKSSSLQKDSDMSPSKSPRKSSLQKDSDMSPSKSPQKSSSLQEDSDMSPSKSTQKSSSLQEDSDMSPSKSPRKSSLQKDSDMSPSKSPRKSSSLHKDNLPNVASYVEANNSASEANSTYDFDKTEESFENIKDIAKQRFARKVSPMNLNLTKLIGGLKPCSVMVTDISLSLSGSKEVSDPGTKEGTDPGTQEESVPETPEDSDTETWADSVPGIPKGTQEESVPETQENSVPETQEDSDTEPWEESNTGTLEESNTGTQTLTVEGQGWTEDKGVLKDQGPSLTEEIIRRTESPSGSLPLSFVLQGKSIIEEEPPLPPGNTHDGLIKYTAALATDFPLLPPISFRDIEIDDHESQPYMSTSLSSDGADVDLESSISAALSALDTDSEKKSKESPEIKLQLAPLDTPGGSHSTRSSQSAAPDTDSQELVDPGESTGSGGSLSSNDEASSSPARKRVGMQASLLPLRKSPRKPSGKEPLLALFKKSPKKGVGMKALLSPSKKTSVREASFSPLKKSPRKSVGLEVSLSPSRKSPRKSSGKETSLSPLKKSPRRSLGVKALPSPSRRSSTTSVLSSWSRDKMSSSSRTTENTSNLRSIVLTREQVEVHPEEAIKAMQRASRTLELEGMSVAASEPTLDQQAEILTENVRDGNQVKSAESAPKEKAIMQKDSDTGYHQLNLAPSDDRTLPAETEAAVSLDDFEESVEDLKLSEREEAMQGDSESDHYTLSLLAVPERKHYNSPSVGTSLAETEAAVYHVDTEDQTENGEPSGEEAGHVTQPQKKSVRRLFAVDEPSTSAALARTKQMTMREFIDKLAQKPVQPPPGVVAEAKARPQLRDILKTRPPAARAPTVVKKTKKMKQKPLPVSLPKALTKEIFTHYALCKISTRGMDEVMKTCEKYWKNLFSDLEHMKTARKGSAEIKTKDMRKLLSRQGLITTDVSLYALVEEYLPVEEWNVIMPTQFAKGRIYPPEEIIDEMFNSG